jgi:DNA-binding PadR family transcriptional regulator
MNEIAGEAQKRSSDLTRGRKFSADELQLQLLWFLRESPGHGYQLIKRFRDLSGDYYSPSPGVLYPALAQLESQNFVEAKLNGRRKSYQITKAGLEQLRTYDEPARVLINTLRHAAKKMLWLKLANENESTASNATGWLPEFIAARQTLRIAMLGNSDPSHDEQRRIAEILLRAATEINKQAPSD